MHIPSVRKQLDGKELIAGSLIDGSGKCCALGELYRGLGLTDWQLRDLQRGLIQLGQQLSARFFNTYGMYSPVDPYLLTEDCTLVIGELPVVQLMKVNDNKLPRTSRLRAQFPHERVMQWLDEQEAL